MRATLASPEEIVTNARSERVMSDLPDWLDSIVVGRVRDAFLDARYARQACLRDGAGLRALGLLEAGDRLLQDAERLAEEGEAETKILRKLRSAHVRYRKASHEALDVSDGKCPQCRARLTPIEEEVILGGPERPVIIHQPALRCGPCGITYGEVMVLRMYREDGGIELCVRQVRWASADTKGPGDKPDDESDDERLWVERSRDDEGECAVCTFSDSSVSSDSSTAPLP